MAIPDEAEGRLAVARKPRPGARGRHKVKSGCQTCKTRHKKCDEGRPACSQCTSTGRRCDLSVAQYDLVLQIARASNIPAHMRSLTCFEAQYLEYFRLVCAREFALYFESSWWESMVRRYAHMEPSICQAALSISAMSRNGYFPVSTWCDPGHTKSAMEFSLARYNEAIQRLNARLDSSVESLELATLASILFIYIEGIHGYKTPMRVHLRGGLALAQSLRPYSLRAGLLESALRRILEQIKRAEQVERIEDSIRDDMDIHRAFDA